VGTGCLFPRIKWPGLAMEHSFPSAAEIKKQTSNTSIPHMLSWHLEGQLYLYLLLYDNVRFECCWTGHKDTILSNDFLCNLLPSTSYNVMRINLPRTQVDRTINSDWTNISSAKSL